MSDAIVIGADVDALVAAHMLARKGFRVRVIGGRPAAPQASGWVPPRVVSELDLERNGFVVAQPQVWLSVPLPGGGLLELDRDVARSAAAIRALSARDAAKWPDFCRRMHALAQMLAHLYSEPPPDPLTDDLSGVLRLAADALRMRKLGRAGIEDLLHVLPMSVADLLDDWFESDALKGALGAAGVMHLAQGPRSGGTTFNFLHHHVGSAPGVFRPPRSNVHVVLGTLAGVETIEGEVERIVVRKGRAAGVALRSGDELDASIVVSGLTPSHTLIELVDPGRLDPELVRAIRNIRSRGVVARITLEVDRAPGFSTLAMAPSLDYIERAYDASKHGRFSESPFIEARYDGGEGRHRIELHVQYAPYALREGAWDGAARDTIARIALETLDRYTAGASATVREAAVLTPVDLESQHGYPHGQIHGAEVALDQMLWMRPVPQLAGYRTPIEGLYLCGASMHPGICAAAGANAASIVLQDAKKNR